MYIALWLYHYFMILYGFKGDIVEGGGGGGGDI